eukprot:CCRYP_006366-RA/>CCRYP_006366-RA protein AED:0.27 eAED:0.27 QI:0/-1/0/1/-1/1/1/0/813
MDTNEILLSKPSLQTTLVRYLHSECGICHRCIGLLLIDSDGALTGDTDENLREDGYYCTVCFGLSSTTFQIDKILSEIQKSLMPYCASASNDCGNDDGNSNDQNISANQESKVPIIDSRRGNYLSRESPTIQIPLLIFVRAHCAVAAATRFLQERQDTTTHLHVNTLVSKLSTRTAEEVYTALKERIKASLREILLNSSVSNVPLPRQEKDVDEVHLPKDLHDEEAGYLSIHVIAIPPTIQLLRDCFSKKDKEETCIPLLIPPTLKSLIEREKNKLQQHHYKLLNPRTRFRGNDPTLKQGGDARKNLEMRMRRSHLHLTNCIGVPGRERRSNKRRRRDMSDASQDDVDHIKKEESDNPNGLQLCGMDFNEADWNTVIGWLDREMVNRWLEQDDCCVTSAKWLQSVHQLFKSSAKASLSFCTQKDVKSSASLGHENLLCCSIVATAWRRPFCIHGYYTKTRRDVSQTPFYVSSAPSSDPDVRDSGSAANNAALDFEGKVENRHKHNSESTQSKSGGMVRKGISSVEEEICPHVSNISCGGISNKNNNDMSSLVYGMCKFHASGREDMDVRMLLPLPSVVERIAKSNSMITGRPFVCEIYDAHGLPTRKELILAEHAINGTENDAIESCKSCDEIEWDQRGWPQTLVGPNRFYGCNVNGVGVSSLKLVSSNVFSTLQSETENKIKHYGCICWSELPIESEDELLQKLGCSPWDKEDDDESTNSNYPLKIHQSTPLRVLHRRSSEIRIRYVLSLSATRIDRHWFRLRLSTSAGTYVKEFVHGDCGRTYPSVRSLLGCRADITELDCEGIVFDSDES